MTLNLYRSTDAGAPQLTGQLSSLIALFDACLRTGYGSGGGAKAGAGWTKPFTAADTAVSRQGAGSAGMCLQLVDSGAGGGGTREARARGYEAMTDATTGTGAFPTTSQNSSIPIVITKSATVDGTYRPWFLAATESYLYFFADTGTSAGNFTAFFFGDIESYKTGTDDYRTAIIGRYQESYSSSSPETLHLLGTSLTGTVNGHFVARAYNGLGSSLIPGVIPTDTKSSTAIMGVGQLPTGPGFNGPNGGVYLCSAELVESGHVRGRLPGLKIPCHNRPFTGGDLVAGSGALSGRNYLAVSLWGGTGQVLIEVP